MTGYTQRISKAQTSVCRVCTFNKCQTKFEGTVTYSHFFVILGSLTISFLGYQTNPSCCWVGPQFGRHMGFCLKITESCGLSLFPTKKMAVTWICLKIWYPQIHCLIIIIQIEVVICRSIIIHCLSLSIGYSNKPAFVGQSTHGPTDPQPPVAQSPRHPQYRPKA